MPRLVPLYLFIEGPSKNQSRPRELGVARLIPTSGRVRRHGSSTQSHRLLGSYTKGGWFLSPLPDAPVCIYYILIFKATLLRPQSNDAQTPSQHLHIYCYFRRQQRKAQGRNEPSLIRRALAVRILVCRWQTEPSKPVRKPASVPGAFEESMIHWILQFASRSASCRVLHRGGNQDIRC